MDGSVRISWEADGFVGVRVLAERRPTSELVEFARRVADVALFNRTAHTLRSGLRDEFGAAAFEIDTGNARGDRRDDHVIVRFLPPRGAPNPDI